jgi:diguanylate cyclase (GGDEF)-like protein
MKKLLDTMNKSLMYHELRDLYRDQLTHLPNRNALIRDLNQSKNSILSLIDIDQFSVLNDLYGESHGDSILINFSNKLEDYFKNDYKIYRVGSDRFVISYNNNDDKFSINTLKQLLYEFTRDIDTVGLYIGDINIDLNITIGIAQSSDKHAFEYAQRAVQKARKEYISILEYDESLFEQKKDFQYNMQWIAKIKNGFSNNCIQPYFQPIIDTTTEKVYKYEALIRYIEPDGKEIAPYIFLPIAKKAKIFPFIIRFMLDSVINIIKKRKIRVAVNLSFDDIINKDTQSFIVEILENNPEESKLIDFEILESEEIKDFNIVREFITKIKKYDCAIGIDDFGAGYSNFNMIEALEIDFVKIDGSLIRKIDQLPKQALIVQTIANFCKELKVKTIAEYVSNESIFITSKSLGVDYMQGWHFGKAVSINNI